MREPLKDTIRLQHILEAIGNIEYASKDLTMQDLTSNVILRHGLTWNIMVIGEAANKLTKDFCAAASGYRLEGNNRNEKRIGSRLLPN